MPIPIRQSLRGKDHHPFLVVWEVTQACDLACLHCPAGATPHTDPRQLTTSEGELLLRQVRSFGPPYPLLEFTGGDPFKRDDLCHLVRYARSLGLRVGISLSATPLLGAKALGALQEAGVGTISLNLDGSCSAIHDGFRGVPGHFARTLGGCRLARELGLKLQVNSTVGRHNLGDLVKVAALVTTLGVVSWNISFLVPTRPAQFGQVLSADEFEAVLHFLADVSSSIPIKTTEAHHYKRILLMRVVLQERNLDVGIEFKLSLLYHELRRAWLKKGDRKAIGIRTAACRAPMNVNAANGSVFVDPLGFVFPSRFIPIRAGHVLQHDLPEIYRTSPLFRLLRAPDRLRGYCGQCEFRHLCGGSRSRAFAHYGDPLGPDPACGYQPGSFPYQKALQTLLE